MHGPHRRHFAARPPVHHACWVPASGLPVGARRRSTEGCFKGVDCASASPPTSARAPELPHSVIVRPYSNAEWPSHHWCSEKNNKSLRRRSIRFVSSRRIFLFMNFYLRESPCSSPVFSGNPWRSRVDLLDRDGCRAVGADHPIGFSAGSRPVPTLAASRRRQRSTSRHASPLPIASVFNAAMGAIAQRSSDQSQLKSKKIREKQTFAIGAQKNVKTSEMRRQNI